MNHPTSQPVRHLVLVLGDQLDPNSAAFDGFDPASDAVWMAEVAAEAEHVWTTRPHIVIFLSAMRHFRDSLRASGTRVHYRLLGDPHNRGSLGAELRRAVDELRPGKLIVVEPGEWRVRHMLLNAANERGVALDLRPDRHFLCSRQQFTEHVQGHKHLVMGTFYREMRRRTGVLVDQGRPVGDKWNFDAQNRRSFGRQGPGQIPPPRAFPPDQVTRRVIALVNDRFADHPGGVEHFDWPVTPAQAQVALEDFVEHRLPAFGPHEDAMWTGHPYLYHSRLSSSLNLKLLDPRRAIRMAEEAYQAGHAPLNSVEGFIRQILGWREFVHGVYWHYMPKYAERNELGADLSLPGFYWTAETDMHCMRECIQQTLDYGFAHHIQRLMVTGLFALLAGVRPAQVHEWYLAVYVDAVEWVELPNTLGMSQFADGGIMATKPYCASGNYIRRMSNYCRGCRYDPSLRVGADACPFTTLYWDFLMRHEERLRRNRRMGLQLRNLDRLDEDERRAIRRQAAQLREALAGT